MPISGFLGENKKPNVKKIYKKDGQNDLLTLQIKYAISKIRSEYEEKIVSFVMIVANFNFY